MESHDLSCQNTGAILISGAASGLGLAFLRHYVESDAKLIIAIDQNPVPLTPDLRNPDKIKTFIVNVLDLESIKSLSKSLGTTSISLMIHCIGVRGLVPSFIPTHHGDITSMETLEVMDRATMQATFDINCMGALFLIRALLPNITKFSQETGKDVGSIPPRVVVLGSRMGSMGANITGGAYAYRASKAALNAVIRSLSLDVREVSFSILHPGRVETQLVPWKEEGAISPSNSVKDCVRLIDGLRLTDSGSFFDRNGERISW